MVDQVASLGIKVDSRDIKNADKDLDKLSSTAKRTEKATDDLTNASKKADKATEELADSVKQASKAENNLSKSSARAAKASDNLAISNAKASRSFKLQKGAMQQAGFQIQDFAVQVAGGQSALVAFGQQGSQLAGVLGPGGAVIGAVIAVASALGGVFLSSMSAAEEETEDFIATMGKLTDEFKNATSAQKAFAAVGLAEKIAEETKVMDGFGDKLDSARARMAGVLTVIETLKNGGAFIDQSLIDQMSTTFADAQTDVIKLQAEFDTASQSVNKLEDQMLSLGQTFEDATSESGSVGVFGPSQEDFDREFLRRIGVQERVAKATETLAKKTAAKVAATQKKFISQFERLQNKVDPVGAELRMLGREIELIQKAFSQGLIDESQADAMVNKLNDIATAGKDAGDTLKDAFTPMGNAINEAPVASKAETIPSRVKS